MVSPGFLMVSLQFRIQAKQTEALLQALIDVGALGPPESGRV